VMSLSSTLGVKTSVFIAISWCLSDYCDVS
jgi:hypothetical protein